MFLRATFPDEKGGIKSTTIRSATEIDFNEPAPWRFNTNAREVRPSAAYKEEVDLRGGDGQKEVEKLGEKMKRMDDNYLRRQVRQR